jgi:hypothetical protein
MFVVFQITRDTFNAEGKNLPIRVGRSEWPAETFTRAVVKIWRLSLTGRAVLTLSVTGPMFAENSHQFSISQYAMYTHLDKLKWCRENEDVPYKATSWITWYKTRRTAISLPHNTQLLINQLH